MRKQNRSRGFTLIELLLVLVILGVISTIGIPALLGARENARMSGDARPNLMKLQSALVQFKMDRARYPPNGTYVWKSDGTRPSPDPLPPPLFVIAGGVSQLDYTLRVTGPQTYTISAIDNSVSPSKTYLVLDQNGSKL